MLASSRSLTLCQKWEMIDRDGCYFGFKVAAEQLSAALIAALFSLLQLPIASVIVQS